MAGQIVKNLTVTRVSFRLVEVNDGVPSFIEKPDAIFRGEVSKERAKKLLAKQYGEDASIVLLNVDSGRHRFVMDFDTFVRNAVIEDMGEDADDSDDEQSDSDTEDGETEGEAAQDDTELV